MNPDRRPRWRTLVAAGALLATGCGATTHPRYAPELSRRWPDCQRIVVIPGTIFTEVQNFKTDDFFVNAALGVHCGQGLAQSAGRLLRDKARREPRIAAEAAAALGGDEALARGVADKMLAHAREWMARDPGYSSPRLTGLDAATTVVPEELRRNFDAILVVGGRTKYESDEDRMARYKSIALRNAIGYPVLVLSVLVPPLFPFSLYFMTKSLTFSGYWASAPNVSYFTAALFDAHTGRLLYANDWYHDERVDDEDAFLDVAKDLLRPLVRTRGSETAPLGEQPDHWEP